jgi:hypothetical protein
MFPSGAELVKLLATLAALLTATGGVPRVRCVCPDGRVKLFCPGPAGCCRDNSPGSVPGAAEQVSPGAPADCCAHASPGGSAQPSGGEPTRTVTPSGCQRTLVADTFVYTAEDTDDRFEGGTLVGWVGHPSPPQSNVRGTGTRRRFLLPPPDRVLLFCYFTC